MFDYSCPECKTNYKFELIGVHNCCKCGEPLNYNNSVKNHCKKNSEIYKVVSFFTILAGLLFLYFYTSNTKK